MLQEKLKTIKVKEIVRKSLMQTVTQREIFQLREWDNHHDLLLAIAMRKEAVLEVEELACDTDNYLFQLESGSKQELAQLIQREHEQSVNQALQDTHDERLKDPTFVDEVADLLPVATTTLLGLEM
ncbi:hypothetical protein [Listeria innocua]|uniref:hypothetical protein n=1 Tax=Listeria innocua TaxID=1642 RepID=UPI001624AF85|nr:hypothetical protein [Listeria innocua]MBC1925566.1 hypothetical protein [Listeria innocua]